MRALLPIVCSLLSCTSGIRTHDVAGSQGESQVIIRNVAVIDPRAANPRQAVRAGQSVLVVGSRIVQVGTAVHAPTGAYVVDGTGKYLMPGLWDMHVHTLPRARIETFFPLLVAHGVTGVRDMAVTVADPERSLAEFVASRRWRDEIRSGARIGPRIVAAGLLVDGAPSVFPFALPVADADAARRAVRTLDAAGAEFIKPYGLLSREAYFALADESRRVGKPFAGHVPMAVSAREASDAGQKSIEHLNNVLLACSSREQELRAARLAVMSAGPQEVSRIAVAQDSTIVDTYSAERARELFERFRRNGTWQVPTLTVIRSFAFAGDSAFLASQQHRMKYMTRNFHDSWNPARNPTLRIRLSDPRILAGVRRAYRRNLQLVGDMHRAGVPILAGTDAPNPYVFPGFSLHDELALLVDAGLTPLDALRAATWSPAVYFGTQRQLGSVEAGKFADLVLLDANPLENIQNTRRIAAVVLNGRLLERAALDSLLRQAESRATAP